MNIKIQLFFIYCIILNFFNIYYSYNTFAITYELSESHDRLVGQNLEITTPKNNTYPLEYFAEKFQIGLSNMLKANPHIDVYLPDSEKKLIIPHQLILPKTPHIGIVINSPEMRLYYYPRNSNNVIIFPIAIGTYKNKTPYCWITSIKYKKKILFGSLPQRCEMNL